MRAYIQHGRYAFFQVFSVWEGRWCLGWSKTLSLLEEWAGPGQRPLAHVPVIYRGLFDERRFREWTEEKLQEMQRRKVEGYVVRLAGGFHESSIQNGAIAKWVRPGHVQTSDDWLREEVEENELAGPVEARL